MNAKTILEKKKKKTFSIQFPTIPSLQQAFDILTLNHEKGEKQMLF